LLSTLFPYTTLFRSFRVLTFEYAFESAFFLSPRFALSPRRRLPHVLELFGFRRRLHCIGRFWRSHRTQIVNGLSHQKLVPKVCRSEERRVGKEGRYR